MSDERILLEFPRTRHKKQDGILYLSDSRIFWVEEVTGEYKINYHYSQIKSQRISPDSDPKVQLQILLNDAGSSCRFHFTGSSARLERDRAKELLQGLLPQFKSAKMDGDLEEKSRILAKEPNTHQLYKELVMGGVVTAEEFWASRKDLLEKSASKSQEQNQLSGLPSAFLADVQATAGGTNAIQYNITADTIAAIFRTYPSVKSKHDELVPHEMTDKEFWGKFLQTTHFHRSRSGASLSGGLFSECLAAELKGMQESSVSAGPDLLGLEEDPGDEGYGQGLTDKTVLSKDILTRCNAHSTMILKALTAADDTASVHKQSLREHVIPTSDVLEDTTCEVSPTLEIAATVVNERVKPSRNFKLLMKELSQWKADLTDVGLQGNQEQVVKLLTPGTEISLVNSQSTKVEVSEDVSFMMKKEYAKLNELLRHFWSCFPVTTPQLEEKVQRMAQSLQSVQFDHTQVPGTDTSLFQHLYLLKETALNKYQQWLERRPSRM